MTDDIALPDPAYPGLTHTGRRNGKTAAVIATSLAAAQEGLHTHVVGHDGSFACLSGLCPATKPEPVEGPPVAGSTSTCVKCLETIEFDHCWRSKVSGSWCLGEESHVPGSYQTHVPESAGELNSDSAGLGHDPEGSECVAEVCGGTRLDPCSYSPAEIERLMALAGMEHQSPGEPTEHVSGCFCVDGPPISSVDSRCATLAPVVPMPVDFDLARALRKVLDRGAVRVRVDGQWHLLRTEQAGQVAGGLCLTLDSISLLLRADEATNAISPPKDKS